MNLPPPPPYERSHRAAMQKHARIRAYARFGVDLPDAYPTEQIIGGTALFHHTQAHHRSHWLMPITPSWVGVVVYDEIRQVAATVLYLEQYQDAYPETPLDLLSAWLKHSAMLDTPTYRDECVLKTARYLEQRAKERVSSALAFLRGRRI